MKQCKIEFSAANPGVTTQSSELDLMLVAIFEEDIASLIRYCRDEWMLAHLVDLLFRVGKLPLYPLRGRAEGYALSVSPPLPSTQLAFYHAHA